uniref:Vomeronasal type-1 receptor n=1 Tax=Nannospalax galili TaxID=1026970 RepID=A0A4Y1N6P1_NANGA|nr:vomeronasal type 1 receptor 20 [Nannospalax galili]AWV50269.1 vomeronasal type 1 receptor 20 [Nannospalax galili]AWV50289.1 vomeronasal type 1 receptor 20 [Nannospalax galili]AWV50293.1 vomeronasal type 1 receptor 20 [Nannospalax galili]AWV50297.1 vomeronasal type 1 receptor 20 [Nannospalax galili]
MFSSDTILGIVLIAQFCVGIRGNSLLFIFYIYTFSFKPHVKRPIDSIFMHLTIVNIVMVIFTLIPDILSTFGVRRFLDDVCCKVVMYVFRVTRALTICTTCILSTFQATTITPSNSKWAWLKPKLSMWTFPFFVCLWLINMLIYSVIVEMVKAKTNYTFTGNGYYHAYCQSRQFGNHNSGSFLSIKLIRDLFFEVLMMWTSLYMVTVLYRHHRRAQGLHGSRLSPKSFLEQKATRDILWLVSCFVFFYWLNNFVTLYGFYSPVKIAILEEINAIFASSFPTLCPFLLMKNKKITLQFASSLSIWKIHCFRSAFNG